MPNTTATAWPTAWPAGVIARYLTLAGAALADPNATVDVTRSDGAYASECKGCNKADYSSYPSRIRELAQSHASTCRALPRPEGA